MFIKYRAVGGAGLVVEIMYVDIMLVIGGAIQMNWWSVS